MRRAAPLFAAGLLLVGTMAPRAARAAGGDRFVLAWPPTRYASAELALWRDEPATTPLTVRVRGTGLDVVVDLPPTDARRVPLPPEAQCALGLDDCAIEAWRVAGAGAFSVVLQSPDTNGAADTLLRTAHDTVRIPPAATAATRAVALSVPCAPATEMPMGASFVTVVPVERAARVVTTARPCLDPVDIDVPLGSALTLSCSGTADDLSGLVVDADAPVLALSGNVVATVPVEPGRGYSGDLLLDLAGDAVGPARFAVPPLPRTAALAGRGDVVRIVALETARVVVRDDRGGETARVLAAGELLDVDTAASGADATLAIEADASVAAWHVPKSRALRGTGDPAAIPLVPSSRFTTSDRVFVPDGYSEATVACVAAEPGAAVTIDGRSVPLVPAPGDALWTACVSVPEPPAGGSVLALAGDRPFGAWVASFGGYKASGHVAAAAWSTDSPQPGSWLLRGSRPDVLAPVAPFDAHAHVDPGPEPLLFWRLEDPVAVLLVRRCERAACLAW